MQIWIASCLSIILEHRTSLAIKGTIIIVIIILIGIKVGYRKANKTSNLPMFITQRNPQAVEKITTIPLL